MIKTDIKNIIVKAVINTEELTNVVNTIFKEINDTYRKGF